jgi:hypothetical protein
LNECERRHPLPGIWISAIRAKSAPSQEEQREEMSELCEEADDDRLPPNSLDAFGPELDPPGGGVRS